MAVSDESRRCLVQFAQEAKYQRARAAGIDRAAQREGYDVGRLQSATRAIVDKLERNGGDMARNDLRTGLSTANREVFDSANQRLAEDGVIEVVTVRRGTRFRLKDSCQGGSPCQGALPQVNSGGSLRQDGKPNNVVSLENRRSQMADRPKLSCQKWFDRYVVSNVNRGATQMRLLCAKREWPQAIR